MPLKRPKDRGWRLFVRTVIARAYPRVIGLNRQRWWMFFDVFLPLVAISAYVLVYRALRAPEAFVGFVILGGAMSAFWLNVLWAMANQLYWEKETGNLALYIMAPNSLMAVLLGMALGGMFSTSLRAAAVITIGSWLFHVHYLVASPALLVVVFVLALVALYGMGMLFASLFLLLGREAWHLIGLAQEPVYFLSGMYFPVRSLHFPVAIAASIIPLTLALDAMRQLTIPAGAQTGFLAVPVEIAALFALAIVFIVCAHVALAYLEHVAIREGRLTESRG